jgi:hypothetical protein
MQMDIPTNIRHSFLSNDPSFLLWLISMPAQEEAEANIAYNFVNSLLTVTLTGKSFWKPH